VTWNADTALCGGLASQTAVKSRVHSGVYRHSSTAAPQAGPCTVELITRGKNRIGEDCAQVPSRSEVEGVNDFDSRVFRPIGKAAHLWPPESGNSISPDRQVPER
jgi:hypothetical protein